jgi:hypothetical protein
MTRAELEPLIMTRAEAARDLGVSDWMIYSYWRRGWLVPLTNENSRAIAYSRAAGLEWQDGAVRVQEHRRTTSLKLVLERVNQIVAERGADAMELLRGAQTTAIQTMSLDSDKPHP